MARDGYSNPESKNYKDSNKEAVVGSVKVLVPCVDLNESMEGVELLPSSIENEAQDAHRTILSVGDVSGALPR